MVAQEEQTVRINVTMRVRPLNNLEKELDNEEVWRVHDQEKCIEDLQAKHGTQARHTFDHVFGPDSNNEGIFQKLGVPIVDGVLEGFNSCIFAYGQTSSGKTHTLMGSPMEPGITVHCVDDLFTKCEAKTRWEFLARISYIEIYNEEVRDLLVKDHDAKPLQIHEDPKTGPYVKGAVEKVVSSSEDALAVLAEGEQNRHFAATNMNARSSRSHVCFILVLESREVFEGEAQRFTTAGRTLGELKSQQEKSAVKVARLNLVDLAGSEKVSKAGTTGERLHEGININRSLLMLGEVISHLAEKCKNPEKKGIHIPYRDSKLTRLLAGSLGGNSRTALVAAVSPASRNHEETHNTIGFASRCKHIVNKVRVNEVADSAALMATYKNEIHVLKKRMEMMAAGGGRSAEDPKRQEAAQEAERKYAELTQLIMRGAESGDDTKGTVDKIRAVAEGKRRAQSVMGEIGGGGAGGRKMSSMAMNSLARISQLNQGLVPKEMQISLGGFATIGEDEEEEEEEEEEDDFPAKGLSGPKAAQARLQAHKREQKKAPGGAGGQQRASRGNRQQYETLDEDPVQDMEDAVMAQSEEVIFLKKQIRQYGGNPDELRGPFEDDGVRYVPPKKVLEEKAIVMTEAEIYELRSTMDFINSALAKTDKAVREAQQLKYKGSQQA